MSKVSFKTLLYPGFNGAITTKIVCHMVPWWGKQGHINISMDENDSNVVDRQITDLISRGCDIAVFDFYGNNYGNGTYENTVTQKFLTNMDARCSGGNCPIQLALMEDHNTPTQNGNCNLECAYETDLNYAYGAYMNHSSYWKMNVAGCSNRPAFLSFGFEGSVSWSNIKYYIHNNMNLNCPSQNEPLIASEGDNGLSDSNRDGGYNWIGVDPYYSSTYTLQSPTDDFYRDPNNNPGSVTEIGKNGTNQFNPHFYVGSDSSTDDWYWNAQNYGIPYGKPIIIGSAYAGFDDTNAVPGWSFNPSQGYPNGRKMARQCGQVWLNAWNRLTSAPNTSFSGSNQIPAVGIPTWNDYEEGTAIEPGIDNCLSVSDQPVSGNNYTFTVNLNDSTFATENTVYEYVIWYSTDGIGSGDHHLQQWTTVQVNPNNNRTYTVSLQGLPTTPALIYAEAIGKPSIFNHITAGQTYNPAVCSLSVNPNSLSFGDQQVNTNSNVQQTVVTASGATCNISSIGITGQFTQNNNCPASLGAGSSCQVSVTFGPTSQGQQSGTLTINSTNSSNGSPQVSLSGYGTPPGTQYVYQNIDNMSGWNACGDPGCAGGDGTATYTLTQNVSSPALNSNGSADFALTGGANYSDIKWYNQQTLQAGSTFTDDLYVYITNTSASQGLAFGVTQLTGGLKYSFRYLCDFRGNTHWQLWNSAAGNWYDTGISCPTSDFPSNSWVHLTFNFQHTSGNQMLYQSFTVNGTTHTVNVTLNPETVNDSPYIKFELLQWGDYNQAPYSVYIDNWNLTLQ